jgi:hypothetical protein
VATGGRDFFYNTFWSCSHAAFMLLSLLFILNFDSETVWDRWLPLSHPPPSRQVQED